VFIWQKIKLQGLQLYSCLFHVPLDWQSNSSGVSSCPFGVMYVGLHDGIAIVLGIDKFEQLAYLPLWLHLISKLFDFRGGHISIKVNKLQSIITTLWT